MSYVFSVGTGSLPEVTGWKGNVYACVWLLPFMTLLSVTAVYAARQQFHPVLNPSLPSPPVASSGTAEWHPPSSAGRAVPDTPNEVREQIQLEEVESFQDGSKQWKGGQRSWGHCGCRFASPYETKLPSPDSVKVQHTNSLNPSSSSFGHHSPSPSVYSSVQRLCV